MKLIAPLALTVALFLGAPLAAETHSKPVKLMQVTSGEVRLERSFYGRVKARRSVDLAFQVSGQVVEFPVIEGFAIVRDATIARLDLETFQLQLDQARLQKEQADRTVARLEKLRGSTVSEVSLEDAETAAALAAIALRNAEWALEHATLTAPFDGLVSERQVDRFSTVAAGTPVVRLHDMSEIHIDVDVPEILFQQASANDKVQITARFPASEVQHPLQVREFNAETGAVGQTFRLTFGMAPPEGLNILPGSSVTVNVRADSGDKAIVIPPAALVMRADGTPGVMVFRPVEAAEGQVTWTEVRIEPTQTGMVRVLSGLSHGDEIVAAGGGALEDGQPVRRFTGFGN